LAKYNTLKKILKKRRMRILGACIFSKSFGGKNEFFKHMLLTGTIANISKMAHTYFGIKKKKKLRDMLRS